MSILESKTLLAKWIRCTVEPKQRVSFDDAQRAWSALDEVGGFLVQTGGWDTKRPNEAGILALWHSPEQYEAFMEHVHDRIVTASGQDRSYAHLETRLFELNENETAATQGLVESLGKARAIRVILLLRRAKERIEITPDPDPLEPPPTAGAILHEALLKVVPAWSVRGKR